MGGLRFLIFRGVMGRLPHAWPPRRLALPNLKEINVPALIVVGEYDIPDCHAHAGVMEAGITGSKRVIVNQAGHIVPLGQPAVFNDIVLAFLHDNR
jgi:pimeloyl-ACP methyl ester carboxylesterase